MSNENSQKMKQELRPKQLLRPEDKLKVLHKDLNK